jgi:uncharacterized protein YjbI with pentapeptide repeats
VAALADRGLIERIVDEADRRRVLVGLTADGRRQLAREMRRRDIRLNRQLARLTAADRALLEAARAVIDRLADADDIDDNDDRDADTAHSPPSPLSEVFMTPDEPSRLDIVDARLRDSHFRDVDLSNANFRDAKLASAIFADVDLTNAAFDDVKFAGARFADVDLSNAAFGDVKLARAKFADVDLSNAAFDDVNLRLVRFADVDLSGATIDASDLTGMRIDGVLVSDLFDAYQSKERGSA